MFGQTHADVWIGVWRICSSGTCSTYELPCDNALSSDQIGNGPDAAVRVSFSQQEVMLCRQVTASKILLALAVSAGFFGAFSILVAAATISMIPIYLASVGVFILAVAQVTSVVLLGLSFKNLTNLASLSVNAITNTNTESPFFNTKYTIEWGLWVLIASTFIAIFTIPLLIIVTKNVKKRTLEEEESWRNEDTDRNRLMEYNSRYGDGDDEEDDNNTRASVSVDRDGKPYRPPVGAGGGSSSARTSSASASTSSSEFLRSASDNYDNESQYGSRPPVPQLPSAYQQHPPPTLQRGVTPVPSVYIPSPPTSAVPPAASAGSSYYGRLPTPPNALTSGQNSSNGMGRGSAGGNGNGRYSALSDSETGSSSARESWSQTGMSEPIESYRK
ncbi:hypothetical protein HDU76_004521 [Blyttiomyces sp. JEL0837]|nr:hypothetical protein HDU76_004521 [Blyttiomyces sp. JEL0837]